MISRLLLCACASMLISAHAHAALQGDVNVHDPSTIIRQGNRYWVFGTGAGCISRYSSNLVNWFSGPRVFATLPAWVPAAAPGNNGDLWAPDIIFQNNQYLLYYSASVFGRNTSAIGLATNPTLDSSAPNFGWTDQGIVIQTTSSDNYNAIDPAVVRDEGGNLWLAFGSYWSGIKMIQLDPSTGRRISPTSTLHSLASYPAIEAAYIYRHNGYYYLFVNWDSCCDGVDSTYNIRVGRSANITGPYFDRNGVNMLNQGGSRFAETTGRYIGPGHMGVFFDQGQFLFTHHYYDGNNNGVPRFDLHPLRWDTAGWPAFTNDWSAFYSFRLDARDENGEYDGVLSAGTSIGMDVDRGAVLRLNGENGYVTLPGGVANARTIAAWVKWNGGAPWQRVFDFGAGTNRYAFLSPGGANGRLRFAITTSGGGGEQRIEGDPLPVGEWTHVALTIERNRGVLYRNGAAVATNTAMTLILPNVHARSNFLGRSQYAVDPHFNGDIDSVRIFGRALSASEVAQIAASDPPEPVSLLSRRAPWRYLDTGTDPGSLWTRPDFNDSSWPLGPAELGFGDGDEATVINSSSSRITTYFRTTFLATNLSNTAVVTARLLRDDGAVVWLNGIEVWRSNMPEIGAIGSASPASTTVGGIDERLWHTRSFSPWALRPTNSVAVEVHQPNSTSSDLSFNFELDAHSSAPLVLVPAGSVWRYRDSGVAPPADWTLPGFNDSTWSPGVAQLGYGDGDEAITLNFGIDPTNKHVATWFRHAFVLDGASGVSALRLRLLRDDGAAVYLNGTEIFRNNMPAGTIMPDTLASTAITGGDENAVLQAALDETPLLTGTNIIAVELHQATRDSTDLSFDLELSAIAIPPKAPALTIDRMPTLLRLRWPLVATGFRPWYTDSLLPPLIWQPVNASILRIGTSLETRIPIPTGPRFFRLTNQ
jgi:hypothetical protein